MTKLLLVGVAAAVIAAAGSVNAAPVAYSWTSCYVGGNGGIGWGAKTFSDAPGGTLIDVTGGGASYGTNLVGGIGGGQVGCDYQFASNFVIGVQGNFDAASLSGSVLDNENYSGLHILQLNGRMDSLFGAVGRVGYTPWSGLLIYADGGAAWAHDRYSIIDIGSIPISLTDADETRVGGVVGVGVEWSFWKNWSIFTEFDHYFFGTNTLPFTCAVTCGSATNYVNISQNVTTWRFGVNWRFGSWAAPH